ncbi:MAG TPA: ABC transporter permease [Pseudonocardiaceae bacterium]|nr:ABC transporter permease [Pseudonocardiaceae bacterium]
MREALHAEWTKLRTVAGTGWLLVAIVVLTVGLSAAAVASCATAGCVPDPAKTSLTGIDFGQAVVAILAALAVSGEYSGGMIRVTFTAMPRRITVLTAKALAVSGVVLVAGVAAVLLSIVVSGLLFSGNEFSARATGGSVLYLVLVGLLSLGVATAVRDSAVAVGVVLALLYLFPVVATVIGDPVWHRHFLQIGPMTAGLAIQATVHLEALPIAPWAGLGVLAAWASGALLVGGSVLRLRDA